MTGGRGRLAGQLRASLEAVGEFLELLGASAKPSNELLDRIGTRDAVPEQPGPKAGIGKARVLGEHLLREAAFVYHAANQHTGLLGFGGQSTSTSFHHNVYEIV